MTQSLQEHLKTSIESINQLNGLTDAVNPKSSGDDEPLLFDTLEVKNNKNSGDDSKQSNEMVKKLRN